MNSILPPEEFYRIMISNPISKKHASKKKKSTKKKFIDEIQSLKEL